MEGPFLFLSLFPPFLFQLHHPFEDDPIYAPSSVDTEEEFEDWVEKNKEPVMQKLQLDNYFNVWGGGGRML